ncbi:hypothetical protein A2W24_00130 [Microgenomates group bacterium RBG_16_45_19]|nr:MAG: hypothetical protein A2W24_00130 [Microgenomates group bacterium RBG_16_45_19]
MKSDRLTGALIVFALVIFAGAFFIPWDQITWGKFALVPADTVTVIGEAKTEQQSQIATFTAGVTAVNDDKQKAVDDVNQKVESLIQSVKDFGIPEADIKTQNLSIYQQEEPVTVGGRERTQPGQWRVSNDVSIKLRQIEKTSELTDLLSASGATNVYGPNFTVDDTAQTELDLVDQAIKNAREKAEAIAQASDKKVGEVLNVTETGAQSPVLMYAAGRDMGGGGGAPVEPGTSTVYKSLTVTFELK